MKTPRSTEHKANIKQTFISPKLPVAKIIGKPVKQDDVFKHCVEAEVRKRFEEQCR